MQLLLEAGKVDGCGLLPGMRKPSDVGKLGSQVAIMHQQVERAACFDGAQLCPVPDVRLGTQGDAAVLAIRFDDGPVAVIDVACGRGGTAGFRPRDRISDVP